MSPLRAVPQRIRKPTYVGVAAGSREEAEALDEVCAVMATEQAREGMRKAGRLARLALEMGKKLAVAGVSTEAIDQAVHELIVSHDAYPSPLLYRGFPKSCCTSLNEVLAHGIPDSRPLEGGDLLNIDVTVYTREGFHGDCSETLIVAGDVAPDRLRALEQLQAVARQAVSEGLQQCGPGKPVAAIGKAVYQYVTREGFDVIPELSGHGIGYRFHTEPYIAPTVEDNYPPAVKMVPGMCFTIEPVVSTGLRAYDTWADDWTMVTQDGSLSAQFEHTVMITESGYEVLTQ